MKTLLKTIKQSQVPCVFISPHLDDAVLSCGELLGELAKITEVTVITVFTQGGTGKETLSAKKTVANSGFPTAAKLYTARRREDEATLRNLGVRVIHLGEVEALWRKRKPTVISSFLSHMLPEFAHIYPTYRFYIEPGRVAKADSETVERIRKKLHRLIPEGAVVFAPIGIGGHVDHLVVKEAVSRVQNVLYWYDQPYYYRKYKNKRPATGNAVIEYLPLKKQKESLMTGYRTQISLLFPSGRIPALREFYQAAGERKLR